MATVTIQAPYRPEQSVANHRLTGAVTGTVYLSDGLGRVTVDTLDVPNALTRGYVYASPPTMSGPPGPTGPPGPPGPTGPPGSGGGGGTTIGIPVFGTVADAQAAVIPDTVNTIQIAGYNTPGDGGAGVYARVSSLPPAYVGLGSFSETPVQPPGFASGGLPVLAYALQHESDAVLGIQGPSIRAIPANCLAFMITFNAPFPTPPSSYADSVGNTYVLAKSFFGSGSPGYERSTAIYYCASTVFAPSGTTFSVPINGPDVYVYYIPGFTGAVLDTAAIATQYVDDRVGVVTVTTPVLSAHPEFVLAVSHVGQSVLDPHGAFVYSLPTGWNDLSPPLIGRNIIGCMGAASTAPVTYTPTYSPDQAFITSIVVAFSSTTGAARGPLDPSFWTLQPSWPVHTAQYGINPISVDNRLPFLNFGRWLSSIAPPSGMSDVHGLVKDQAGTVQAGSATISIPTTPGAPAVISLNLPSSQVSNGMQHTVRNGQGISFGTSGSLPAPIVPGKIYHVQYGTAANSIFSGGTLISSGSIQISDTTIFNSESPASTSPKGTPISTFGATQSGTHSWTTYGEDWTDFVIDPGIYHAGMNVFPGKGVGLKRWRARGAGSRFQSGAFIDGVVWNDINAATDSSGVVYSAKFKTTRLDDNLHAPTSITLFNPAEASNFFVNSWVLLMALEMQISQTGNWNQYYFEYVKVKSINTTTGVITFYDALQHNYRSTYPRFAPPLLPSGAGAWPGASIGPATIVQMSDTFDQEIEIHSVTFSGATEMNFAGVLSLRLVDCYIYGWGFKTGPFPSTMKTFVMERCVCENYQSEIDKMVDAQYYIDCTFDKNSYLIIQSSSTNKMIFERCRLAAGLGGTPKDLTVRDCFIGGLSFIGTGFGGTERILFENTHIQALESARGSSLITRVADTVFSAGTIKVLVGTSIPALGPITWNGPYVVPSSCPILWCAPGTKVMLYSNSSNPGAAVIGGPDIAGTNGMVRAFTVLDAYTDDFGNFCVDTDMDALPATSIDVTGSIAAGTDQLVVTAISPADALPLNGMTVVPVSGGDLPVGTVIGGALGAAGGAVGAPNTATPVNTGTYGISHASAAGYAAGSHFTVSDSFNFLQHPCPRLTVRNCTGGRFATDWAGAPADIPYYSYFRRAIGGFPFTTSANTLSTYANLSGNLISWTIDVKKPYTGSSTGYVCTIVMIGWKNSAGNYYPTWVQQKIDLTKAGLRTITQTAVTSPAGTADALVAAPFWLTGDHWIATGTPNSNGIGSGSAGSGDTLAKMPVFVMQAQTDQGIGFGSEQVNTLKSGNDFLTDSTTHGGNDAAPAAFASASYYVAEGDSITLGANTAGYPALYGVGGSAGAIANLATGGASLGTLQDAATRQAMLNHIISFKRTGDRYVLSVMIGTNDVCFGYTGGTRTAFLTQLAAYCDLNRSNGWYVIICTQISRGSPATTSGAGTSGTAPDNDILVINTELRKWTGTTGIGGVAHADAVCDFAGNAAFTPGGTAYNNATNYQPDKTHPTAAGENLMYTIIKPIIDGAIIPANSPFNPAATGTLAVLTNSNFDLTAPTGSSFYAARGLTGHSSGKFYFEFHMIAAGAGDVFCGVGDATTPGGSGMDGFGGFPNESMTRDDGFAIQSGAFTTSAGALGTITAGTVIGIAVDFGAKTFVVRNNNVVVGSTGSWTPAYTFYPMCAVLGGLGNQVRLVTGATTYPPPTGFTVWG